MDPRTVNEAVALLEKLGASSRLVTHGRIVATVAEEISTAIAIEHDRELVVVGAVLHDSGKIVHPEELDKPGSRHEHAGERLLIAHGLSPILARVCRYHGSWRAPDITLEELVVAVADHVWRGARKSELEGLLAAKVAQAMQIANWEAYIQIEPVLGQLASRGQDRLSEAKP